MEMTKEQMMAEIARLKSENQVLIANKTSKGTSIRMTDKGGISLYGLGKYPVTLYKGQWEALFIKAPEIKEFIEANKATLEEKEKAHEAAKASAKAGVQ